MGLNLESDDLQLLNSCKALLDDSEESFDMPQTTFTRLCHLAGIPAGTVQRPLPKHVVQALVDQIENRIGICEAVEELTWSAIEADEDEAIPDKDVLEWFETAILHHGADPEDMEVLGEYYNKLIQIAGDQDSEAPRIPTQLYQFSTFYLRRQLGRARDGYKRAQCFWRPESTGEPVGERS